MYRNRPQAARNRRFAAWRPATLGFVLLALLAAGCSTAVPFDYPKIESTAVPPSGATSLGRDIAAWNEGRQSDVSGFYPLFDGMDALGARLRLIERAEQTIDAQYFLIKGDLAGSLFAGDLMRAADRGVRVRFLIDDVFTSSGLDPALSLMNSHPNIEVRLFNPISRSGVFALNYLVDFQRANRRMHNKSFIVDNAFTIVGGRNIADEYFRIGSEVEFADLELLGLGPVAAEVSETFDLFWNSELAVPMEAYGDISDSAAYAEFRDELDRDFRQAQDGVYGQAMNTPFIGDLLQDRIEPLVAAVDVVTDHPDKLRSPVGEELKELAAELERVIVEAQDEVIILTPYFVPGRAGVEWLRDIRAKGVRVVIITNSLASTNHIAVHSGYAPYRSALLKAGIELYEVKVDSARNANDSGKSTRLTLHTKAVVIDRRILFVGSLNFDPRSIDINTEMGLFLHSAPIAGGFAELVDGDIPLFTYRVALDNAGSTVWHYEGGDLVSVRKGEPDAGFWRRFKADLFLLLPLESQL